MNNWQLWCHIRMVFIWRCEIIEWILIWANQALNLMCGLRLLHYTLWILCWFLCIPHIHIDELHHRKFSNSYPWVEELLVMFNDEISISLLLLHYLPQDFKFVFICQLLPSMCGEPGNLWIEVWSFKARIFRQVDANLEPKVPIDSEFLIFFILLDEVAEEAGGQDTHEDHVEIVQQGQGVVLVCFLIIVGLL